MLLTTLLVQLGGSTAKHNILFKLLHKEKQDSPNEVIPDGNSILVKLLQSQKHLYPNEVIPEGKETLAKLLQIIESIIS